MLDGKDYLTTISKNRLTNMNDLMVVGTLEEVGGARGAGYMWSWYLINNDKKVIKNKDGNEMKWNKKRRK